MGGFVHDGDVVCNECFTRFLKPSEVQGEGNVMLLAFECWRGHRFAMRVEYKADSERVRMEWVRPLPRVPG